MRFGIRMFSLPLVMVSGVYDQDVVVKPVLWQWFRTRPLPLITLFIPTTGHIHAE